MTLPNADTRSLPLPFRENAAHILADLFRVLDEHRAELEAAVQRAAAGIPAFAEILAHTPADVLEQQGARSRELERGALLRGEWGPYLADLREQGVRYARMGIAFGDWFRLLGSYRSVVLAHLVEITDADLPARAAAMDDLLDLAMATIGAAYIEEKETALLDAQSQRDVYLDLFRDSTLGKLVYEWTAPPDPGSFVLVAANPAASRIAGRMLDEAIGRALRDTSPGLFDAEVPSYYAAAIETRTPQRWQRVREDEGHGRIVFDCRCFPLHGGRVGVVFEDVTEKHALQQRIARHVKELERSNRDLDEFAYVASHDLKAPLRDIVNLATWIDEDAGEVLPEGSRRHLTILRDRTMRMERLLEDLLEYSRAGRVSSAPQELSAAAAADDAIRLAGTRGGFVVRVQGDARLTTPRAPLVQVVRNLVANALKHHDGAEGHVDVTIEERGDRVRFEVRDDGPGIPPELHERIFGLFQTLRPRDQVEGSGMGLAIVKKLVEAHGGRVAVVSAPGEGSAFSFTWPKRWSPEEPR